MSLNNLHSASQSVLRALWSNAFEGFVLPNKIQFIHPILSNDTPLVNIEFPIEYGYALTAFNPAHKSFPQSPSLNENIDANKVLRHRLKEIEAKYMDVVIWPSYGFGNGNWREDGFTVGCSGTHKDLIEIDILGLANEFGQGLPMNMLKTNIF